MQIPTLTEQNPNPTLHYTVPTQSTTTLINISLTFSASLEPGFPPSSQKKQKSKKKPSARKIIVPSKRKLIDEPLSQYSLDSQGPDKVGRSSILLSDIPNSMVEARRSPTRLMKLIAWNCQSLESLWTVRILGDLIRHHSRGLDFLAETKCSSRRIETLKRKFNMFGISVHAQGKNGGLALLWNKKVSIQLQSFSLRHIDASVQIHCSAEWWHFTNFYDELDVGKQIQSWNLLRQHHHQSAKQWMVADTFNDILEQSEKQGGPLRPNWRIRNFCNAIEECKLSDLGYEGYPYTWCNNQIAPHTLRELIDRACVNLGFNNIISTG
ncbi:UNVERIFIED_CONTAM: hypothetical protein Slati_0112600 [Sesamum latifolium]|uniref:Endonuclease/exonuclease/phosphatase n=1 Tax=Sesamum latifolium TaxID=2727402 RepID=A0AAW2Y903_9LAMI